MVHVLVTRGDVFYHDCGSDAPSVLILEALTWREGVVRGSSSTYGHHTPMELVFDELGRASPLRALG